VAGEMQAGERCWRQRLLPSTVLGRLAAAVLLVFAVGGAISYRSLMVSGLHIVEGSARTHISTVATLVAARIDGDAHEAAALATPDKDGVTRWGDAAPDLQALQGALAAAAADAGLPSDTYTLRLRESHRAAVQAAPDQLHPDAMEFILTSGENPYWRHTYEYRPEMAATLFEGRTAATDLYQDEHGHWLSAYAPVRNSAGEVVALLEVDEPPEAIHALVRDTTAEQLSGLGGLGLVLMLSVLGIAAVNLKPLRPLRDATERLVGGDYGTPISAHPGEAREIGELTRGLESARAAIQAAFERQRELQADLAVRNGEMKMVLDNVEQGILTVDRQGRVCAERSAAFERWFGAPADYADLGEHLSAVDPEFGPWFEMGLDGLTDGWMPLDLCLTQMPRQIVHGDRTFEVQWRTIPEDSQDFERLLVVISDVTARLRQEAAEAEQRELSAVVDRILSDRAGFLEFFEETGEMVRRVASEAPPPLEEQLRDIHTIKGNSGIYGLSSVAARCHAMETNALESGGRPLAEDLEGLSAAWGALEARLGGLLEQGAGTLEVCQWDLGALEEAIAAREPHEALAERVRAWRYEPTARRLERVAEQARALAERLGKGPITTAVEDNGLRLNPASWSGFWSSFIHVVRNSVDHGLEGPGEREEAGKDGPGALALRTAVEGGRFVVSIRDNGRGIAWEKIRAKAVGAGLPARTQADLVDALFADGVSSRDEVSETSGRGVGMGAVKAAVLAMGGQIEVESVPGEGTVFRFSVPAEQMTAAPDEALAA
jgi:signal transduction histidine kinase